MNNEREKDDYLLHMDPILSEEEYASRTRIARAIRELDLLSKKERIAALTSCLTLKDFDNGMD